ncbi:MAG: SDR family oxidoreductase [Chloroflexi bacterium]|nr:SDR family oxidoreductase [Chloroflexota bacterium]
MGSRLAGKVAIVGMTKALAVDYAANGIRVNAICPGPIETPMLSQIIAERSAGQDQAEAQAKLARRVPIGRIGRAEDVAAIAVHLASDESSWTTGISYPMDGGEGLSFRLV